MNKQDVKTKEDLELYYTKCRKIKFRDNLRITSTTQIFNLMTRGTHITTYPTFYTRGAVHCNQGRSRSLDDIIKVCKFYFSNHKVEDIITKLSKYDKKKADNQGHSGLYFRYCPSIRKHNFAGLTYYSRNFTDKSRFLDFKGQGFNNCNVLIKEFIKQ